MTKQILILFAVCLTAFGAYATAPTITSFSPASGPVGTLVIITGTNLSSPTGFTIGGVPAIAVSNTGTTLIGMIMPGAATGTISVTTSGGTASGSGSFTITPTPYPQTQQGLKLVGTGAMNGTNGAEQGWSVAISADGGTAIVGGKYDNKDTGAAWVYSRSGSTWTQQGLKLVGTGAASAAEQGTSVALSADGSTAIVGGYDDGSGTGAAWVYTRSGSTWTQQGLKLAGTGGAGSQLFQGTSVALSADGNTAIMGGPGDSLSAGAAWVFTRSGTTWAQQGLKLVGTGAINGSSGAQQGGSVALSADGGTAIVGGLGDNGFAGAAWVYARSGTTWTQQGPKLVGTGVTGIANQGQSVALSADGRTAIVGGLSDSMGAGAVWIYTRSGATWTQQGGKLVGTGASGGAEQGWSVALSADGGTAIVGGDNDNSGAGAVWIFTRSGGIWTQQGGKLVGTGASGAARQAYSVALSADGRTSIMGGRGDNSNAGAAWVFISCSPLSSTTYDTIMSGALPYIWNGLTFTGSGSQTAQLTGSAGCDSAATLILTVRYTGISEITGPSAIHLYPNPNTGTFTLATDNPLPTTGTYTISTMLGQVIQHEAITSGSQTIDIGAVPAGIYMLSITGTSEMVKFAVMR